MTNIVLFKPFSVLLVVIFIALVIYKPLKIVLQELVFGYFIGITIFKGATFAIVCNRNVSDCVYSWWGFNDCCI